MNPLILRGIRERLRTKHLIASGLFSLILCSTIYLSLYLYGSSDEKVYDRETKTYQLVEGIPANGAREAFTKLLIFQGFLLMFLGTGRVASVTAEEKESGLLDYQRMTPMNPLFKINAGLVPKNAGFQSTRSAIFPTSTDPTSCAIPCAIAGLMVYFAMYRLARKLSCQSGSDSSDPN